MPLGRCLGVKRNLHRCNRSGSWRFFCGDHRRQPIGWASFAVFTVIAGASSIYSAWWRVGSGVEHQAPETRTAQPVTTVPTAPAFECGRRATGQQGAASVELSSNGCHGTLYLVDGSPFSLDWISANVTDCSLRAGSVSLSGVTGNGSAGVIQVGHPYYPRVGSQTIFRIKCTGLAGSVGDSVIISVRQPPPLATSEVPHLRAITSLRCGGAIDLDWLAVRRATRYELHRDGVKIAEVTETRISDAGLAPDSAYSYEMRALGDGRATQYSAPVRARASAKCEA